MTSTSFRRARLAALLAVACVGLAAAGIAGCSSSSSSGGSGSGSSPGSDSGSSAPTGPVRVAYAASLAYLNEKIVGPAFTQATGLQFAGTPGPSDGLSQEIDAREITPDVFESVGGKSIEALEPKFTSWYVQFATTSIVLAYNPHSKYASQFKAIASGKEPVKNLFSILEKPGFKLGRTDPNTDPQGRAFIFMLQLAQMYYHLPKDTVSKIIGSDIASANSPQVYEEVSLDSHLQSGQLDAASAYLSQARQLHLSYITLPDAISLGNSAFKDQYAKASITITTKDGKDTKTGAPLSIDISVINKSAAGTKFAAYILSQAGLALHKQGGYTLLAPKATGTGIPPSVHSELGG